MAQGVHEGAEEAGGPTRQRGRPRRDGEEEMGAKGVTGALDKSRFLLPEGRGKAPGQDSDWRANGRHQLLSTEQTPWEQRMVVREAGHPSNPGHSQQPPSYLGWLRAGSGGRSVGRGVRPTSHSQEG